MKAKKRKLNIIDIIIILFLVFALSYAIVSFAHQMKSGGNDVDISYVIETDVIRTEMAEKLSEGDKLFANNGKYLGIIENVEVSEAYNESFNSEGLPVNAKMEGYSIIYITVSATVNEKPYGYDASGVLIAGGKEYILNTSNLYFEGECVKVSKTENS